VNHSEAIGDLAAALAKAQAEMRPAVKDAQNPHLRNKYADLGSCWDACRDPLARHGLAVVQGVETSEVTVTVTTTLVHASGQWVRSALSLPWGESKGTTPAQAIGSVITYGRRYGLSALVGITTDDDDGASAGQRKPEAQRRPEPAAKPKSDAPTGGHHASWDADRARFCAELGRMGMDYDRVKAVLHARGKPKPSTMTQETRNAVLSWLGTEGGRKAYESGGAAVESK
jgi:hypothetical protein